jgi:hypothetical protein
MLYCPHCDDSCADIWDTPLSLPRLRVADGRLIVSWCVEVEVRCEECDGLVSLDRIPLTGYVALPAGVDADAEDFCLGDDSEGEGVNVTEERPDVVTLDFPVEVLSDYFPGGRCVVPMNTEWPLADLTPYVERTVEEEEAERKAYHRVQHLYFEKLGEVPEKQVTAAEPAAFAMLDRLNRMAPGESFSAVLAELSWHLKPMCVVLTSTQLFSRQSACVQHCFAIEPTWQRAETVAIANYKNGAPVELTDAEHSELTERRLVSTRPVNIQQ